VLEGHIEAGSEGEIKEETAILAVAQVVQDARTSAAVVQNQTPASYESLLAAVELESTNMYELFSSVKTETSPDEAADIERRIEDIKRKVATAQSLKAGEPTASDAEVANVLALIQNDVQGGVNAGEDIALLAVASDAVPATKMAENTDALFSTTVASSAVVTTEALPPVMSQVDEQGAIDTLKLALTDIQKLINYLTNIDVRENVSIEKLVPVTKTAGERATEIKMIFDEVKLLSADVDSRTLSSKLRSKVRYGRERIEEKLTAVSEFMGRGDLEGAHAAASEARVMALDLQKLVANEPQKSVTEETTEEPVEEVETDVAEGVDAENQAQ
jgi:hypothetical protein